MRKQQCWYIIAGVFVMLNLQAQKTDDTAKIVFIRTNPGTKTGHDRQCQPEQHTLF